MKHLFILNPAAAKLKGRVEEIKDDIDSFFSGNAHIKYDIHVTRWIRDASAFVHRYALEADCLVRIHSFGGAGTLFEVLNGIIGLPNVQLAVYPMGSNSSFLRYFGKDKTHLFNSLRNQVFSGVTPIDALRCGRNYGISYGLVGLEAEATKKGTEMTGLSHTKSDIHFIAPSVMSVLRESCLCKRYNVSLDGRRMDGDYITMMIANAPCYGKDMRPASDAHPNDGRLEVYLVRDMSKLEVVSLMPLYLKGYYDKLRGRVEHYSGERLSISSENVMCLSIDGETFYENSIEFEILPYAIDLVCPYGIDPEKLPAVFGRPEEGSLNGR